MSSTVSPTGIHIKTQEAEFCLDCYHYCGDGSYYHGTHWRYGLWLTSFKCQCMMVKAINTKV